VSFVAILNGLLVEYSLNEDACGPLANEEFDLINDWLQVVEQATNGGRTVARTSAMVTKEMGLKLDEKMTPRADLFANHAPWMASEISLFWANPECSLVSWTRNTLEMSNRQCTTYLVMKGIPV
jgi:hypothetical protein